MPTNKITPYKDLSWYIKWASTAILLVAITSRAAGGCLGWTVVGFMWHDRALMILNSTVAGILTVGVLRVLFA